MDGGQSQAPPLTERQVLRELSEAAERFANKAPKQQRLEADRKQLLDALTRAQLLLSLP